MAEKVFLEVNNEPKKIMNEKKIIAAANRKVKTLRDPETAKVYTGPSEEYGAGWYDVGLSDDTGDMVCIASAVTDIGSHAESMAREISIALGLSSTPNPQI